MATSTAVATTIRESMVMDRRDFLAGIGHAAAFVAAGAQGCDAGEPSDIARAEEPEGLLRHELLMSRDAGYRWELKVYPDRVTLEVVAYVGALVAGVSWPNDLRSLAIARQGERWHLRAEWGYDSGPWIGRVLQVVRNGFEERGDGEWLPVGRIAGES